jgi:hypothetical protein
MPCSIASASVTAGFRCAPEIGPNVRMRRSLALPSFAIPPSYRVHVSAKHSQGSDQGCASRNSVRKQSDGAVSTRKPLSHDAGADYGSHEECAPQEFSCESGAELEFHLVIDLVDLFPSLATGRSSACVSWGAGWFHGTDSRSGSDNSRQNNGTSADLQKKIHEPGKMPKVKRIVVAQLPVHPQYLDAGTTFNANLLQPLDFGTEAVSGAAYSGHGRSSGLCLSVKNRSHYW